MRSYIEQYDLAWSTVSRLAEEASSVQLYSKSLVNYDLACSVGGVFQMIFDVCTRQSECLELCLLTKGVSEE